jgi:hypothetical protein
MSKRFLVALSFPGEKRGFVETVANTIADVIGKEKVLYDRYLQAELARLNLDLHLGRLYHDESELIVPFFCADYERKEWCGLEWRQIRDLAKQRKDEQIMPFRFDDTPIPGVLSIDGYLPIGDRSPQQVADLILERLALIGADPRKSQDQASSELANELPYFLFASQGTPDASPENVFFAVNGQVLAETLVRMFGKEYGETCPGIIFHCLAAETVTIDDKVLLNEAINDLRIYEDPDPFIYDPPPSKHTMERAQFSHRADGWEGLVRNIPDPAPRVRFQCRSNRHSVPASERRPRSANLHFPPRGNR